jgi:hypothetical protein
MSDDRPLTEFVADEDAADDEATGSDDDDDTAAGDAADSPVDSDAEPAIPTYRWHPEGATCADCGATTERQWRGDAGFVCSDCKSW